MLPAPDPRPVPSPVPPRVHGVDPDPETRCAHYRGPLDRVAIRFRCCRRYYCCHACHEALESHEPVPWPPGEFDQPAVLCGSCGVELTIRQYLDGDLRCPGCGAEFNGRCADHHHLYFQVGTPGGRPGGFRP